MKLSANALELASALALAASLSDDKMHRAFDVVHLSAAADALTITANVLDFALTQTMPAVVAEAGEVAVPASRLAALLAGFDAGASIEISSAATVANVGGGRSRFRLATVGLEDLPSPLKLTEESGRVELAREEAARLLVWPAFATSAEKTRYYLNGVLLRDDESALTATATDGCRLARTRVPGATGLSSDLKLIVPNPAIKIIAKLLADKNAERVTLRRSRTLLSVEMVRFVFVSKLIDATYPDCTRLFPQPSGNAVTVDRAALLQALDRVAAVAEGKQSRVAGLVWTEGEPALRLCLRDSDAADDVIDAEVTSKGRVALQIPLLAELLDQLGGDRVCLDSRSESEPVLVTDSADHAVTALIVPCTWAAPAAQAA